MSRIADPVCTSRFPSPALWPGRFHPAAPGSQHADQPWRSFFASFPYEPILADQVDDLASAIVVGLGLNGLLLAPRCDRCPRRLVGEVAVNLRHTLFVGDISRHLHAGAKYLRQV